MFRDPEQPADAAQALDVTAFHAKIDQLTLENDFSECSLD